MIFLVIVPAVVFVGIPPSNSIVVPAGLSPSKAT